MKRELEMSSRSVGQKVKCLENHLPGCEDGSREGEDLGTKTLWSIWGEGGKKLSPLLLWFQVLSNLSWKTKCRGVL